jgi:hypothetical protein
MHQNNSLLCIFADQQTAATTPPKRCDAHSKHSIKRPFERNILLLHLGRHTNDVATHTASHQSTCVSTRKHCLHFIYFRIVTLAVRLSFDNKKQRKKTYCAKKRIHLQAIHMYVDETARSACVLNECVFVAYFHAAEV